MRSALSLVPRLSLLSLLTLTLAACPGNGTGATLLTPQQVGDTYEVCSLVFTPQNDFFRPVDVRAQAINTTPQAPLRPGLRMREEATNFEFRYTTLPPASDIVLLGGTYQLGVSTVTLVFTSTAAARSALLLPPRLELEFEETPQKQLSTRPTPATYNVPRANYARLAGISEQGLALEIPGTLAAHFAVGSCE